MIPIPILTTSHNKVSGTGYASEEKKLNCVGPLPIDRSRENTRAKMRIAGISFIADEN